MEPGIHPYNMSCMGCRDERGLTAHPLGSHVENLQDPVELHRIGACTMEGCSCKKFTANGIDALFFGVANAGKEEARLTGQVFKKLTKS